MKFLKFTLFNLLSGFVFLTSAVNASDHKKSLWTIDDLLLNQARPITIGHRGYGENLGENPNKPLENTIESVSQAFSEGVSIVEVDVVVSSDGHAVALHDDYFGDLSNYVCVNVLTYDQLKEIFHHVPTLKKVLRTAKKFARKSETVSGLVNIEVKTPAPICDPLDYTEMMLVHSVIDAVNKTQTHEQVIIEAVSPALMGMFMTEAPELKRNYSANALQFMTPSMIEATTGLHVELIDKQAGFGLQWAEVGPEFGPIFLPVFRLPGYVDLVTGLADINGFIQVAAFTGSQIITFDKLILQQMEATIPGSAQLLIHSLHQNNFTVTVYTIDNAIEWTWFATLGVDAIYTNEISLGLSN